MYYSKPARLDLSSMTGTLLPHSRSSTLVYFAWAIFPFLAPFLSVGVERFFVACKDHASKLVAVSGDECRRITGDQVSDLRDYGSVTLMGCKRRSDYHSN